jgi:hypothetical protein
MPFQSYKEESRRNWGKKLNDGEALDTGLIQLGAILRIADATELMASNFLSLQAEVQRLRESKTMWMNIAAKEQRRVASLKGVITKLKKKNGVHGASTK